jgi:hypothetical protein
LSSTWAIALAAAGFVILNVRRVSPLWVVATGAVVGAIFGSSP